MTGSRLLFVFLTTIALAFSLRAQSVVINGRVEDAAISAVAGATVVLRNQKTGLERIATTNKEGAFSFSDVTADGFEVIATASGFARTTAVLDGKTDKIVITLQPAILREEVTVVSGSRQEELRESLNTKVDVLTRNDLKTTGYENVGEALREVPGVITRRGSETSGAAGEHSRPRSQCRCGPEYVWQCSKRPCRCRLASFTRQMIRATSTASRSRMRSSSSRSRATPASHRGANRPRASGRSRASRKAESHVW